MPELERIRCQYRQILMDDDSSLDHVFFPDSGVVSVVAVYSDGSIIEMATIGREGFTDVQAAFGAKTSSARLLVQIQGSAAKMSRLVEPIEIIRVRYRKGRLSRLSLEFSMHRFKARYRTERCSNLGGISPAKTEIIA